MTEVVVLLGYGDVGLIHEPMAQYSELVAGHARRGRYPLAQVERVYSERG